jgi:hypothetical protein
MAKKALEVSAPFRDGASSAETGYFLGGNNKKGIWAAAQDYESIKEMIGAAQKMFEFDQASRNAMMAATNQQYLRGTTGDFYDSRAPYGGSFSQNFKAELARMEQDFNDTFDTMAKKGKESAKIVADAMAGAFNDFFIDAIEGRLQQFKDYLLSFFTSIGRAISQILSQYLAVQAIGYIMPGMTGGGSMPGMGAGGVAPGAPAGAARLKAGGGATPIINIVNNSGVPMEGSASYSTNDMGETVMTVVLDAVGRNKGGSRDALRAMLAT